MNSLGRWDGILLAVLLLLLGGFFLSGGRDGEAVYGEIHLEGELYRRIELTGHEGREVFEIETPRGRNTVVVEDESIFVDSADCPDKVCVRTGKLRKPGETAACLPHKLLIEIVKKGPQP